ncbi:MAG: TrpB-like pyridoxal phosphate-dependent enzyme [Kiritimatiellae bacterium]|nr:TrpB-like pyridoxal phosphate-dependent enzyme [Kiritimatiellia bacterium]
MARICGFAGNCVSINRKILLQRNGNCANLNVEIRRCQPGKTLNQELGRSIAVKQDIPYKTYLEENETPKAWYNMRADMKKKPAPLLNPGTGKPVTAEELGHVFCDELVKQELDNDTPQIPIPGEILDFYRMFRPSPLVRAYFLERALGTPAKIFYKFEGNNTSGSHKLNSAVAQAYYAKAQGLKGVTTETGAGQWGTALSMACSFFKLDCKVFMVKCSYEQKPFRREVMRTYGASVTPSPSMETEVGRRINAAHPGTTGSLGCAISEAVEAAVSHEGYRYVLGSVLSQVLLHQSIIGLETQAALRKLGVKPDVIIGCAGGGSNLGGLIAPFMGEKLRGEADYRIVAVEPASCPSLTRGRYAYDFCDTGRVCPLAKMYTLGHDFIPSPSHAGGLRYHGMSSALSELYDQGMLEARAVEQTAVFAAAEQFARVEGILPAPESSHAIRAAIDEALRCKAEGREETIVFGLTGTGYFDLTAYQSYNDGKMQDYVPSDADLEESFAKLPKIG